MKERSLASLKREEKRNSPEIQKFKSEIDTFLGDKPPFIQYTIKRDLAVMTNMPYYKDRPKRVKIELSKKELLIEWVKIFLAHDDFEFITQILKNLNRNQSQLIRKIAPRIGQKKDIWEHPIPSSFFVNKLLGMIKENDISDLPRLIDIYSEAGQRALTKEQDLLLYKHKSSMPDYWDWKKSDANPLERHIIVGINSEIL